MLTEVCQYLHNWFEKTITYGKFSISDNDITSSDGHSVGLIEGQYYRIVGSLLNDGVHQFPSTDLKDESFEGAIWSMAVPPAVLSLSEDVKQWQAKHGSADSYAMSPFNSESFGGYSYSKSSGGSSETGGGNSGWQSTFAYRLKPWRKLP